MTDLRLGTPKEAGLDPARIDHLRELCRCWVEQDVHKALSVLVARRGVVALHEAFGPAGPHGAPNLKSDSIFPTLSLSKVVTATALMILVEDGLVGLTRPVQEYIPEFAGDEKGNVLVHHLLTHTSGLREEINRLVVDAVKDPMRAPLANSDPTLHPHVGELLLEAVQAPLGTKPGEQMFYCNHNYRLVGEIVRRVSGCALSDFASKRIFDPLNMESTSYVLPDEHVARTIGWSIFPPPIDPTIKRDWRRTPFPDAGVFSTTMDVAVFVQTFLNGGEYAGARILGPAAVHEMTRDQIPDVRATFAIWRDVEASWGYGWGVTGNEKWPGWPTFPRQTFAHSGAGSVLMWGDPAHQIVGVYFSICRYKGTLESPEPITNVDLFVNAVTAAVDD